MKYLVYALSVGAMIGTFYNIAAGITYADIACVILLMLSLYKFATHQWTTDRFFTLTALYVPFMIIAAVLNGDMTNTIFINYFRNYFWGVVIYFALSNSINSLQDIKKLVLMGSAFFLVFLLNYRTMIQDTFSESLATLDFGYGRNNVAFTALLFSILFEFLYYTKLVKSYILLGIVIMAVIIVFCTSRYSMMMLVISFLLFRFFSHQKVSGSEVFSILLLIIVGPLLYEYILTFVDSSFYEYSQSYLNEKMNGASDDFWNSRIMSINVKPIQHMLDFEGTSFLFIGNPLGIQHSFFSHSLITTGIAGCLCYLVTNIKLLKWSFQFKGEYLFLFIVVMVMFANDFITNARFIIGVNSVFYCYLCAIMYRYIIINENVNISE
ncbi:hypothetical protein [Bacteroides thetaiotaomicron]|uniref:Uncharacterized protein n=1 Tax=Bacteroides thetaiotaomicron TaxID=818 RepID=A0AAW4ZC29_BACT4|nr:hypothetical protein [Bacteroides thetaiotaomicron]MCE9239299.1 hypothetical protein [Bacteroides thetaiotaomicron]MCE9277507.1 hypothetical protein [Bacteroides thetaiotaomicron]MCE9292376.1 hypothetical protein [Bacteroides thetaiotaomicron]